MLTVRHRHVDRTVAAAHSTSIPGDVLESAYNSARRLGGIVKITRQGSNRPVLSLSGRKSLSRAWQTLALFCDTQEKVEECFIALKEMGLPVSALDDRLISSDEDVDLPF